LPPIGLIYGEGLKPTTRGDLPVDDKGCVICGDPIKAKYLCAKHHQRMLRTGSAFAKDEKEVDIDQLIKKRTGNQEKPKRLNLAQYFY
jgi:hypothetical protein